MVNYKDQDVHLKIIKEVLDAIFNERASSDLTLKGGTALLLYYGLDRFSEDIDLDATKVNIKSIISRYCKTKGYSFNVTKDTSTVKRYMINYGDDESLKVEVSYRGKNIIESNRVNIDGVNVYTLKELLFMKIDTFLSPNRNKIRDLYDIAFIYHEAEIELTDDIIRELTRMFMHDMLDYIFYVVENHKDFIIPDTDSERILEDILYIYDDIYGDNTSNV